MKLRQICYTICESVDASTFQQALESDYNDHDMRLVYSDWLEEHGQTELAEFYKWLGSNKICPLKITIEDFNRLMQAVNYVPPMDCVYAWHSNKNIPYGYVKELGPRTSRTIQSLNKIPIQVYYSLINAMNSGPIYYGIHINGINPNESINIGNVCFFRSVADAEHTLFLELDRMQRYKHTKFSFGRERLFGGELIEYNNRQAIILTGSNFRNSHGSDFTRYVLGIGANKLGRNSQSEIYLHNRTGKWYYRLTLKDLGQVGQRGASFKLRNRLCFYVEEIVNPQQIKLLNSHKEWLDKRKE